MKKSHIFLILFIIVFFLVLPPRRGGIFSSRNVTERDTTIYNVTYRDSVVYNIIKKDSVITDYRLVSVTEFDTTIIHDTTYVAIPIASYHFTDTMSDIWASGYGVTLDSVRYHVRDVTKMITIERTERPKILTADAGLTMYTGRRLDLDLSARIRLGERWSIDGSVGISTGDRLSPFAALGVRYALGAE